MQFSFLQMFTEEVFWRVYGDYCRINTLTRSISALQHRLPTLVLQPGYKSDITLHHFRVQMHLQIPKPNNKWC